MSDACISKYIFMQLYGITVDVYFKQKVKPASNWKPNGLRKETDEWMNGESEEE